MSFLPNPDTYLNHIPPAQAAQFEAARNLSLAVLGATIWDILVYIPDDVRILRRSRFRLVTVCFLASRLFALVFVLLAVIVFTHPVNDCNAMTYSIGVACSLTVASTTFIFLQRLRAVYSEYRKVQIVAILLWLGTCVTMAFTVVDAKSVHIPGTQYCAYSVAGPSLLVNGVVFLAFDTFAFVAVSYKVATSHSEVTEAGITWGAISGTALPQLSRAVLRGGQQYYLITLCLQIPVLILTAIPSVSPNLKLMFTFPLGCLAASMAARIFRNMKMHSLQFEWKSSMTNIKFAQSSRLPISTFGQPIGTRTRSQPSHHAVETTFPRQSNPSKEPSPDDAPHRVEHLEMK